jgi:hypothetical protein
LIFTAANPSDAKPAKPSKAGIGAENRRNATPQAREAREAKARSEERVFMISASIFKLVDFGDKRGQLPTQNRIPLARENASMERSGFNFKRVDLGRVFHGISGIVYAGR